MKFQLQLIMLELLGGIQEEQLCVRLPTPCCEGKVLFSSIAPLLCLSLPDSYCFYESLYGVNSFEARSFHQLGSQQLSRFPPSSPHGEISLDSWLLNLTSLHSDPIAFRYKPIKFPKSKGPHKFKVRRRIIRNGNPNWHIQEYSDLALGRAVHNRPLLLSMYHCESHPSQLTQFPVWR